MTSRNRGVTRASDTEPLKESALYDANNTTQQTKTTAIRKGDRLLDLLWDWLRVARASDVPVLVARSSCFVVL